MKNSHSVLICSPGGEILEIGTGTGLSLAFILDGMDDSSTVTTIDNAEEFQAVARNYFGFDERITFYNGDGNDWLRMNSDAKFDLIFADAWPGKYMMLEETLAMLKPGGIYFIDDMNPQPNWPEGHDQKALALEKCRQPRNPLCADSGEGWGAFSTRWRDVSTKLAFFCA